MVGRYQGIFFQDKCLSSPKIYNSSGNFMYVIMHFIALHSSEYFVKIQGQQANRLGTASGAGCLSIQCLSNAQH